MSKHRKWKQYAAELEAVAKAHDGVLLARDVVDYARRHPKAAIHGWFEWNTEKAAQSWLIYQARRLIRVTVTLVEEERPAPYRVFVSLTPDRAAGGGYRRVVDVLHDDERRAQMLADALSELRVFQKKYSEVKALLGGVFAAIEEVAAEHEDNGAGSVQCENYASV